MGAFFEIKLLLQPDVVFDSESNGRNFSTLAPPGGEKKYLIKTPTPTRDITLKKKMEKNFFYTKMFVWLSCVS